MKLKRELNNTEEFQAKEHQIKNVFINQTPHEIGACGLNDMKSRQTLNGLPRCSNRKNIPIASAIGTIVAEVFANGLYSFIQ